MKDPIVEEIRKIREEHARRCGNDLAAICKDLKRVQDSSGCKVVRLAPVPVQRNAATRNMPDSPSGN